MKNVLLLFVLLSSFLVFSQEIQEKFQQVKIHYSSDNGLERLANVGIPVDHGIHKKGHFFISDYSVSEIATIRAMGYTVDVMIEDSEEYFLRENASNRPFINEDCNSSIIDYITPINFGLGSMGGYLTYQEALDQLDLMKSLYPDLITAKSDISNFLTEGQPDNTVTPSIGGNGIKWVKISDNPDTTSEGEPQILYTAIHHAREPMSLSQLVFYMWYLLENYDTDPEIQSIVNNTELYFVPVVNPDGYLYNQKTNPNGGGFWRKNRKNGYGTDLNRNYNYYINGDSSNGSWGGEGTSGNTDSDIYHGPTPFSEVETQAIKWFVEQHDFVMAFNNHSFSNLLLYPFGYTDNMPTPEDSLFEGVGNELVSRNGYTNQISSDLYPAAGNSDDFMYGTVNTHNKIYSFTPEIGSEFWPPSNEIESIAKEMMYLNITSAQMVNNYATIVDTAPMFTGSSAVVTTSFDIKRLGISGDGNFTVRLNPISANIASVGTPITFSGLNLLEEGDGLMQYTIAGGTQAGEELVFELIVNNGSYDSKKLIYKKFGSLEAIFEDAGDSVTENFNNNGWATTTSTFVSPSSSITESPGGNYQNNANKTITLSEPIDLSDALGASVSFYAKWEIENNWDYTQFEVSINDGSSWIPQCGNFTNSGSSNSTQPTGEPLYDGNQNDWVLEEIDLNDYLGETILVRFQFESDTNSVADGFYFDDLTFSVLEDVTLSTAAVAESPFSIYPNPVKDLLNITTPLSSYTIEVYTIQGTRVQKQDDNSGSMTFAFDSFATGIYILKLTSESASQTFKIVKE